MVFFFFLQWYIIPVELGYGNSLCDTVIKVVNVFPLIKTVSCTVFVTETNDITLDGYYTEQTIFSIHKNPPYQSLDCLTSQGGNINFISQHSVLSQQVLFKRDSASQKKHLQ